MENAQKIALKYTAWTKTAELIICITLMLKLKGVLGLYNWVIFFLYKLIQSRDTYAKVEQHDLTSCLLYWELLGVIYLCPIRNLMIIILFQLLQEYGGA